MHSKLGTLGSFIALILMSSSVFANTTTNWTRTPVSGPGDWFVTGNWDNGLPNLTNGAQINNAGTAQITAAGAIADYVTLGFNNSDSGTLSVSGVGTLTTNNRSLDVGADGTGTVNITGGGMVTNNFGSDSFIGDGSSGVGTVTVDGTNSAWTNTGNLIVGRSGNGTLHISGGGTVSNMSLTTGDIAQSPNSTGLVTVDGNGSLWSISSSLTVGDRGNGTMTITNGGQVTNVSMAIVGENVTTLGVPHPTTAIGVVNVDGKNSMWTNTGDTIIGLFGSGTMNVTGGGDVKDADGYVSGAPFAGGSPGLGAVVVDGTNSTWESTGNLNVGFRGPGSLTIRNGGLVNVHLDAFIGSDTGGNGTVNVSNSTWLMQNLYVAGNSSGPVGPGLLKLTNGGAVVVAHAAVTIWSGGTVIDDGFLVGDSGITISHGSVVSGNGGLTSLALASVTNSGILSPGDPVGTLTVESGHFIQNSDGLLKIEIGGLNAGVNSDLLRTNTVNNGTSLDGTLELVRVNNFKPQPGSRVNIINDIFGTHSGTFSTLNLVNWGLIRPVPMYDEANDVYVVFRLTGSFVSEALTRNQTSVANNLDNVSSDPRAADLIGFLGTELPANLPHDYDLIAPEELASIYEIGFSQATVMNQNLMHRMDDIRAGSTGYSGPVVEIPTGKDEAPISDKNVATKNVAPAFVPCPENRWGVFALGSGDFVTVGNGDDNARGYDLANGSMLVGVDYRFGNHFAVGIDGEYANDIAQLTGNGRVYVDGGKAGAFATVYGFHFLGSSVWLDLAGNGGWNNYDTKRVGLQDEIVRGSTDGAEWNGMLAYGADWNWGQFTFGTWSTLQYTDVQFNGFTETGSLAPLEFPDQDEDSFRTTSGIRASYEMKFGNCGFVRPEVRAAWQHEYGDDAYPIDSRLASGAGDVFRVWGPTIGRDAALVDVGATVQLNDRFSTYVFYDGVLCRSNYQSNAVSGGLRVSF